MQDDRSVFFPLKAVLKKKTRIYNQCFFFLSLCKFENKPVQLLEKLNLYFEPLLCKLCPQTHKLVQLGEEEEKVVVEEEGKKTHTPNTPLFP